MTAALVPRDRLAAPIDSQPKRPMPPTPPNWEGDPGTAFAEPEDPCVPSYLALAREHSARAETSSTAAARLAQAEQNAGNREASVAAAQRVLELTVSSPDTSAQTAAVQILALSGTAEDARFALRTLSTRAFPPTAYARLAIAAGDIALAREALEGTVTFEGLMLRAWLALESEQYREAIALLRRSAREFAVTPGLLTNLAYAHAALGELEKAAKEARQAQALAPADRQAAFNLVSYELALGRFEAALDALARSAYVYPEDVDIALARAHVHLRAGDREQARRILQRARTSVAWTTAPLIRRAELMANLAFLRWLTKKNTRSDTVQVITNELARTGYESLSIASLLPSLFSRSEDASRLRQIYSDLGQVHGEEELLSLRVHLAALERDADAAIGFAKAWHERDPFSPLAASVTVYLLAYLGGRYEEAAKVGYKALRRAPGDAGLINNVAYTLALMGKLDEARTLLRRLGSPRTVVAIATQAMVDLWSGHVGEGLDGYRRARDIAIKHGDTRFAYLVEVHRLLALAPLDLPVLRAHGLERPVTIDVPERWYEDTSLWLASHRAARDGVQFIEHKESAQELLARSS